MKIKIYILYFFMFFTLFYLESFEITSDLTFSQVWKIPLVLFMIFYVIVNKYKHRPRFNKFAYYSSIKNIFNQGILTNPITNIIETFRFTNFPLLYDTFNIYFKDYKKLQKFVILISQYFILSNIPFLLGILESVNEGKQFEGNVAFIGIFQNMHGASIITSFSLLVLIYFLKTNKMNILIRYFNFGLIILGTYCLYLTFVRTGYVIFVIGLIIIFLPSKIKFRQIFIFLSVIAIIIFTFNLLIESNQIFRHRIFDENEKGMDIGAGSGRLIFAAISLDYWASGNIQQLLFGRGLTDVKENLANKTGMLIFSHNGFIDSLVINGLFGISLFILFLVYLYKNINHCGQAKISRLTLAMFFSYLSFQLTQGGASFPIDLFMVSVLNLMNKEYSANFS